MCISLLCYDDVILGYIGEGHDCISVLAIMGFGEFKISNNELFLAATLIQTSYCSTCYVIVWELKKWGQAQKEYTYDCSIVY